mgnify:CR=1 FL=1
MCLTMMDFIGKLSGFVGKNLTYIVLVVVVAAYFMGRAAYGPPLGDHHVRYGDDPSCQRL